MPKKSKSYGASMIELVVAVLIFSIAAALCTKIFVTAMQISDESQELTTAVLMAESAAEIYRAKGDISELEDFCVSESHSKALILSYKEKKSGHLAIQVSKEERILFEIEVAYGGGLK
ncbi:type II secretion system GspH family protein [Clostridiaceae bacterium OttesenSCG-928-D20]|nr:type II secretion system GspH family protein [Clostridiaceae bacterium OttesenSCG-928-D20]